MKTVKKALSILDCFSREVPRLGVTDLANRLGMHKSGVHGLLSTLREEGYVVFDPETRKYALGYKPLELAGRISYRRSLVDIALPLMQELASDCEEDVGLNILVEGRRVCIALVESRYFVRQFVPQGKGLPLHCSAAGKVLMAYLTEPELEDVIKRHGLSAYTPKTITDRGLLLAELQEIRDSGYGESYEEYGRDAAALAFPIFNAGKELVACLSIQSTVTRLTPSSKEKLLKQGMDAAARLSVLTAEKSV